MSEKKDSEYYVLLIKEVLKNNLNTKIIEINTLKNDGISLSSVNDNAYYFLTFGQNVPAYDPSIFLGYDVNVQGQLGYGTSETLICSIEMIISSKMIANEDNLAKIICRYRRAVSEVINENYRKFPTMEMESLPNVAFTHKNNGALYYSLGYAMQCSYSI